MEHKERPDRHVIANRRTRLRKAMVIRLNSIGAHAWQVERTSSGMPTVQAIWGGEFYGFYPSGITTGSGADISDTERKTMEFLIKAGATCAVVASIDSMEKAMNLTEKAMQIKRLLPRKTMYALLKSWGAGKQVGTPLDQAIEQLRKEQRKVIYGIYLDKQNMSQIAEEMGYATNSIASLHQIALNILADRLVTAGTYMEGLTSAQND